MSTIKVDQDTDLSSQVSSILPEGTGLFWDGRWHSAVGVDRIASFNPSTGDMLGEVLVGGTSEVDKAVASARRAFPGWASMPPLERAKRLRDAAARIRAHAVELALLDAADCGNPVKAMLMDAEIAATQLEYFAGLVLEVKGETIPTSNGSLNYTLRQPRGVVVRIFPFNHPFMFAAGKIAAPLAAGNTVILKPPEQAPLSTLRLLEILGDLFPPGVLNCVTGGRRTGELLVAHTDVDAVALIGSVPAGKSVLRGAAETMKHTLLELGGKNAMVIYPDADFEKAVDGAIRGMNFTWCGQSCGSTSRLFVHSSFGNRFVDAVAERLRMRHVPGIATDMRTTMGALINQAQHQKSVRYIEQAKSDGARLVAGGRVPVAAALANGYFLEPTVFTDVHPTMSLAKEEIFGPILAVMSWDKEADMLSAVNGVPYGLTASLWTKDLVTAHRVASCVEAGYIWVNDCSAHITGAPFGGFKQSGIGREESKEELLDFTQIKNVNVSLA